MFTVPKLKYGYDSLSPAISSDVMIFHHDKHHQTYVDKLNLAVEANKDIEGKGIEFLLVNIDSLPETARTPIKNMGGGHYNHCFFWDSMSPDGGGRPSGDVLDLIVKKYGSFENFMTEFSAKAVSLFGSGWVWLQPNGDIISTPNQDTPIAMGLDSPLLCIDVWEHAYYLDYKNRRDEYVKSWWNIVDWNMVAKRYATYLNK